jgi:4'-phosphopantetheinyl transferase
MRACLAASQPRAARRSGPEVWRVRIDISSAVLDAPLRILSEEERQRAARFRLQADRTRYVLARASLRRLVSMRLAVPNERVVFGANALGKPVLAMPGAGLHFNSSHSGDWILHAFDTHGPVGVDVEKIGPALEKVEDFAIALSPEESLHLSSLPRRDRACALARTWVRKEAYVKAAGEGVARTPARISIGTDARGRPHLLYDRNPAATGSDWSFEDIPVDASHVACVVYCGGRGRAAAFEDFSGEP